MAFSLCLLAAIVSYLFFDRAVAHYFWLHPWSFFKPITYLGNAALYLVPSLILFLWYRRKNRVFARKMLYLFASVALSGILTDILKILIARPRPKIYFNEHLYHPLFLKLKAAFWSMPSGHTTTAFAAAMALALIYPKYKWLFLFLALLVGISRVALHQHFISDVIVGACIGSFTAIYLYKWMIDEKK